jgi:hypothetical protein
MKAQPNSSLKFLESITTAIISERKDIEKTLVSEKTSGSKNDIFAPYRNMEFIAKLYIVDSKSIGPNVTHTEVTNEVKIIKGKFKAFETVESSGNNWEDENPMNLIYINEDKKRRKINFSKVCKDSIIVFKNNDSVTFNDVLSDIPPRAPLKFGNAF